MNKNHITKRILLHDSRSYSGILMYDDLAIYTPQQYNPTECEEDPDTSVDQLKVLKNDWSYSHQYLQEYP